MTNGTVTTNDVGPALDRCRKDIAEFKRLRLVTEAAMHGIVPCKVKPEQLAAIIQRARDPLKERMAAEQHREFLRMLYKREPTAEELRAGPPTLPELEAKLHEEGVVSNSGDDAMGIWWVLPAAAVVGGAWGLSNLFSYLTGQEARVHGDSGIIVNTAREMTQWSRAIRTWALPVGLLGVVGTLGYFYLKTRKTPKAAAARAATRVEPALPPKAEMKQNEEPEDEEELEDEEGLEEPEGEVEEPEGAEPEPESEDEE